MTILLEKWLHHRVGYCVQLGPKDVGLSLYDGKVFFDLLKSYGILDIEMFGGIPGRGRKTPDEALRCLKQLTGAFCFLHVQVDDDDLKKIANRNGPLAIRLLSQLYLKLQNRNYLDLLDVDNADVFKQKTNKKVLAMNLKYRNKDLAGGDGSMEMARIKMFDNATRKVKEHCEKEANRVKAITQKSARPPPTITSELLTDVFLTEDDDFYFNEKDYVNSLKSAARQKKNEKHQKAKLVDVQSEIPTDVLNTMDNEFSSSLKTSMNHQSHYEKYQAAKWSKAHHTLARFFETGLYKYTDSDEEIDKEHVVKNKTLREGGEAIAKQQEPTWILHKKLYAKRLKHRKRCNFEMCRHIVQDLVDVLMKVLLYRYEHKREPVPRKVMNDWKECFWKCQLTVHPDPLVYDDSSVDEEEFVPEEVIDYLEDEEEYSEIILDQEITRILHEYDLHCYLYEVGPWDLAKWPDWDNDDENLMISGFIVHRLLQTKYPLPRRYQDPKLDFKVRAAVNPLQDQNSAYIYNSMRNLLAAQKVLVIDIAEPVSFCLAKYNEEISAIGEIENAVQAKEQAKETKPTAGRPSSLKKQRASKAGSKGGKKSISMKGKGSKDDGAGEPGNKKATGGGRKSKMPGGARKSAAGGSRKSAAGGGRKSAAGGARKSAAGGARKSAAGGARKSAAGGAKKPAAGAGPKPAAEARKSVAGGEKKKSGKRKSKERSRSPGPRSKSGKRIFEKSAQCPSVDELLPRVNHSPAGILGKEAFTALNEGRPVGDLLAGKMIVEFLKTKGDGMAGFALLSFPLTVSQAVLLEFLLTGRPVKTDYKVSAEVAKFIHDELRPQPYIDTRVLVDFEEIFRLNNIESIEGGANEVFEIDAGSIEDLRRAVEAVRPGDVPISGSTGDLEEETQNNPGGEQVKIIEYPYWDLKPHKQLLTAADVKQREKIRNQAYNTGRFRPYLLEEDYLKMKTHVLCLISYLRSRKKHQPNPCNVLVQASLSNFDKVLLGEENEEKSEEGGEERAAFGLTTTLHKVEEHKRPVTYTQILKLRSSEILPRPNKDEMEIHYRTSAFIQKYIKWLTQDQAKSENDNYQARKEKYDKIMNGELPQEENFALDPIIEESPDSFYKIFGTKLNCDYNRLDYDSITRICRMIIGEPWEDADLERKRSAELFDIEALQKLMKDLPGKKKASGSSKRKSKAPRKSKAARKSAAGGARKSKTGSARKSTAAGASKRQSKSPSKGKPGGGNDSKSAATSGKVAGGKPGEKPIPPSQAMKESAVGLDQEKAEESPEHPLKAQTIVMPQPDLPLPPRPGELGWEYVQEPVPDILQIYLATTWESIEFEYLANLKTALRAMRTHDNTVIPYRNFIREEMERHLEMSDDRMKTVDLFQENFNKVEQKARNRADVKQSLHCRAFALYNDLVDIADDKRSKALARREDLLNQQWVPKHLFTLANLYRNLIQAEINRTVQTLQLLHDYYYAMLQKPPCETRLQRLSIPKVFYPEISDSLGSFLVNNLETSSKPQLHDDDQMNADALVSNINHILSSCAAKLDIDSTNPMIDESITLAKGMINDLFDYYESLILDPGLGKELRPKVLKKQTPEEEKARRKQEKEFRKMLERRKQVDIADRTPSENRDSKPPKIKRKKDVEHTVEKEDSAIINKRRRFQIDASQLQMVDKLKWEWLVAVQNEIARFHSRLDLIEKRGKADFEEVLSIMKAVFDEFLLDVGWHYRREMSAIEEAVNIFKAATDTAVNIPVQMNLGSIRFYLGKRENADLFPEVPPPPNSPSHQVPPEFWPTMHQLSNFMRKIEDASPNGMLDGCLIDVLEDMVIYCKDTNFEFLPGGWAELTRKDIEFLVDQTFGSKSLANWREFLLYCVDFEYPTLEEIVEMRIRFREADVYLCEKVDCETYMKIPLWFENEDANDDELLWNREFKNLLFKLFRTARKEINYTDLLLSLCKGRTQEEGLGKGLGLMDGYGYIFWPDPPDFVHPRHVVDYVLNQILHDVIIRADYVTITELFDEEDIECEAENEEESLIDENAELGEEERVEEEENIVEKYKIITWKTCVPYKTCQTFLFAALRFSELPASQMVRQLDVEVRLKRLFGEKGVGTHMKAYELARSELMAEIFQTTCAFRECSIPEMVHSIVMSKHHTIGGR